MHIAIAFGSEDRISRSPSRTGSRSGRSSSTSSVGSSAYSASTSLLDERTGRQHSHSHNEPPKYHAVMLPEGAPTDLVNATGREQLSLLWNAVEAAEHRKDSQVARHIVLALPDAEEVTLNDRIELVRTFAEKHFVSEGVGVQVDIHAPEIDEDGTESNWHAHLLITTRRFRRDPLKPERYFEDKKARDLDPLVRSCGGVPYVTDGTPWGEEWRVHQERFFREKGYKIRVDLNGLVSQKHLGPRRTWPQRSMSELSEFQERIEANWEAAHDPEQVLKALTRYDGRFSEDDVTRFLSKNLDGEEPGVIAAVHAAVMTSPEVRALLEPGTLAETGRFTTREVRRQEREAMDDAAVLDRRRKDEKVPDKAWASAMGFSLRGDQAKAFEYAIAPGDLKLIEGRAGTGKSYTLRAIRGAFRSVDKRVVSLAPTNDAARAMRKEGFKGARTVHSALLKLEKGHDSWDKNTVVMVDEAAMLGAVVTGDLLAHVRKAGAKLILVGDDRQLASIERGGLFSAMLEQYGSAEVTGVVRQQVEWQRQAAEDLAQYRFSKALTAFDTAGAITWTDKQDEARAALVAAWARDAEAHKGDSQFVFAYTNRDVDALNADLRQVRRARGELGSPDVTFTTTRGSDELGLEEHAETFAKGDRVQFTKTDKRLDIYNGTVGTITEIDPVTGDITAEIDGESEQKVTWNAHKFQGFRLGYAGTIYRGQGKTLDRTYLYHTDHWRAESSYVALTRQRKNAQVFVARETARTLDKLARQMERSDVRCATLEWATRDDPALEVPRARFQERNAWYQQGKKRFRESVAAYQQEDRPLALARDWVRAWYRISQDFYQALPLLDRDPAYGEVRSQLLAHARALEDEQSGLKRILHERPELMAVPSDQAGQLGETAQNALKLAVSVSQPNQVIAGVVDYAETEQRADRQEQQQRAESDLLLRQRDHIETRG